LTLCTSQTLIIKGITEKEKNLLMDRAITWEWLAGFFDGEGHFTKPCWRIEKGQPYIDLNVKVDQKKETF